MSPSFITCSKMKMIPGLLSGGWIICYKHLLPHNLNNNNRNIWINLSYTRLGYFDITAIVWYFYLIPLWCHVYLFWALLWYFWGWVCIMHVDWQLFFSKYNSILFVGVFLNSGNGWSVLCLSETGKGLKALKWIH